jgi:predicted dehydrogenase
VDEERFEIYGRAGKLIVDRLLHQDAWIASADHRGARARRIAHTLRSLARAPYVLEKRRTPGHEPSHRQALALFAHAARENRPAKPDLQDGYESLAVLAAAEESARTRRAVAVASHRSEAAIRTAR